MSGVYYIRHPADVSDVLANIAVSQAIMLKVPTDSNVFEVFRGSFWGPAMRRRLAARLTAALERRKSC